MLARIAYLLLLLLFGSLSLGSGLVMPETLRSQLPSPSAVLAGIEKLGVPVSADLKKLAASGPQGGAAPTAKDAKAPPDKDSKAPPKLESFFIPTPVSAQVRYTLNLGLYPGESEAKALVDRVLGLRLPKLQAAALQVRDERGDDWWLVTAGDQGTPDDLEQTRSQLVERLKLMSVGVLIAPPPKS